MTQGVNAGIPETISRLAEQHPLVLRFLTILICVAYPYLCRLGGFPNIDEGVYAYTSLVYNYNLAHGQALAPLQGFTLWSLLLAWIPDLPGMPLLWFRLADMIMALLASWLICAVLQKECGIFSCVIAFAFLACMTDFRIIESGFKNAIFPAWACFFGAILLGMRKGRQTGAGIWFLAGSLTALGILIRETFFPYALLGFITVWKISGFKNALSYALGGIFCACLTFGLVELIAPGSLASTFKGYLDRTLVYQSQTARIWQNFYTRLRGSLIIFTPALLLGASIFAWNILFRKENTERGKGIRSCEISWTKIFFWLCVSLAPLYETVVKISFNYHFAQTLPGLACLVALFAGQAQRKANFKHIWQKKRILAAIILCIGSAGVISALFMLPSPAGLARTANAFAQLPEHKWPEEMMKVSTPLQVVEQLQKNLPPGGTLSTSGAAMMLFPASGFMPPLSGSFDRDDDYLLGDLSRFYVQLGKNREKLKKALMANPPDIIALIKPIGTHEPSFPEELEDVINSTGLYEKFADIDPRKPDSKLTHYTWTAFELYRLKMLSAKKAMRP